MMAKQNTLRASLQTELLVADGAMATVLYQQGVPVGVSTEELCLSKPEWVRGVHEAYIRAGARVIETNSYAANREALSRYGLEDKTIEINRASVKIAHEAVERVASSQGLTSSCFVIGSVGSILAGRVRSTQMYEYKSFFEEQAVALLEEGVDGIILETFFDLEELLLALDVIHPLCKSKGVPIISQLALLEAGRTRDGYELTDAFVRLQSAGAEIVGLNCRLGPADMIRSLERTTVPEDLPISVYPNAGRPSLVDGEFAFTSTAAYLGESAIKLWEQGVRLIGGCCGTTPAHIRAISIALQGRKPLPRINPPLPEDVNPSGKVEKVIQLQPHVQSATQLQPKQSIVDLVKQRHTVIVEFDTPRGLDIDKYLEGARALHEAGVDAITMADNSLATTRMSNMALGTIIKRELGVEPIVHLACRDRNLIGQQSQLMGLHALGINQILVVTGDPARVGDLPGASSVFDVSSFDLIRMVKQLNEGVAFSGRPMKSKARFVVGAAFNPHVRHLDAAVARLEKKVEAGADFIMTQPVYDVETLLAIRDATRHIPIPIFIGVMPLTSHRNATFLHNEVPGIKISQESLNRIGKFQGEDAKAEGLAMAKELLNEAVTYFRGIYLITPFNHYDITVELTQHIHKMTQFRTNFLSAE